jgi:hypothetical protein
LEDDKKLSKNRTKNMSEKGKIKEKSKVERK